MEAFWQHKYVNSRKCIIQGSKFPGPNLLPKNSGAQFSADDDEDDKDDDDDDDDKDDDDDGK